MIVVPADYHITDVHSAQDAFHLNGLVFIPLSHSTSLPSGSSHDCLRRRPHRFHDLCRVPSICCVHNLVIFPSDGPIQDDDLEIRSLHLVLCLAVPMSVDPRVQSRPPVESRRESPPKCLLLA